MSDPTPETQASPEPETPPLLDAAATLSALQKARDEAAKTRIKLREAEKRLADQEESSGALSQLQAQLATLQQSVEAQTRRARDAQARLTVIQTATQAGLAADLVADLIRPEALEYNEAGEPTNVRAVVEGLAARYPQLTITTGGASVGNPARTQTPQTSEAELRARIYGTSGGSLFDPHAAAQHGGGVYTVGSDD